MAAAIIVAGVISAYASIQQGRAVAQAEQMRQDQFERQQQSVDLGMRDELNERRRQIAAQLGEQAAKGASSGFDAFGAGSNFLAIREETERVGATDQQRIRLVGLNQMQSLNQDILQSQLAASSAKTQSYLKAASTIAGSIGAASSVGGGGVGGGGGGGGGGTGHGTRSMFGAATV